MPKYLMSLLTLLLIIGCAIPLPPGVTVVKVDSKEQIGGHEAVRWQWPDHTWSLYLPQDAPRKVLIWELESIEDGRTNDPI